MTTLRQATQDDIEMLLPLMEQFYTYFTYDYEAAVHRRVVADFLANPHWGSLWLIGYEGTTVGYLALTYGFTFEWKGRDAFVDELFVIEQYRSSGVGRKAVETIQQEAHRLGLVALHLQTEAYNGRAKRLYEALGFTDLQRNTLTWLTKGD